MFKTPKRSRCARHVLGRPQPRAVASSGVESMAIMVSGMPLGVGLSGTTKLLSEQTAASAGRASTATTASRTTARASMRLVASIRCMAVGWSNQTTCSLRQWGMESAVIVVAQKTYPTCRKFFFSIFFIFFILLPKNNPGNKRNGDQPPGINRQLWEIGPWRTYQHFGGSKCTVGHRRFVVCFFFFCLQCEMRKILRPRA